MFTKIVCYKGRIMEIGVEEVHAYSSFRLEHGRGVYVPTVHWWLPGANEVRLELGRPSGIMLIAPDELGAVDACKRIVMNWIDGVGFAATMLPAPPPPSLPRGANRKLWGRDSQQRDGDPLLEWPPRQPTDRAVNRSTRTRNGGTGINTKRIQRSNLSRNGLRLHGVPGQCEVCRRTRREVELHPYTSSQKRLFCRTCHDVTKAMRILGYSASTGRLATTVVAQKYMYVVKALRDKEGADQIAKLLIYIEYRDAL